MSAYKNACRICLKKKGSAGRFIHLFPQKNECIEEESLAGMFEFVANVSVLPEETSMPQQICSDCLKQLKAAYCFRKLCIDSDEIIRKELASEHGFCSDDVEDPLTIMLSSPEEPEMHTQASSSQQTSTMYLQHYDTSFYHIVLDRYFYMVLNFDAHRCCGCRKAFATLTELQAHCRAVHKKVVTNAPYHCDVCYAEFPYADALEYHRQSVRGSLYCCRECNLVMEKKSALFAHLCKQHSRSESELEKELDAAEDEIMGHSIFDPDPDATVHMTTVQLPPVSASDSFVLGYCELSPELKLTDLRPSQYRVEEQTDDFCIVTFTWHRCCACNHMFASQNDLDIHCTEEHRKQFVPVQSYYGMLKPFLCQQCWRRFKKKSLLGLHQKFNRKKVYACNHCLHFFFGRPAYEKHRPSCKGRQDEFSVDTALQLTVPTDHTYVGCSTMSESANIMIEDDDDDDDSSDVFILND